eukprot:scaffold6858_cov67-Phaeocystis_antarctica.AAC.1
MLIYYRTSNHNIDTVAPLPVAAEPRLPLPFGSGHVLPLPLTGPLGPDDAELMVDDRQCRSKNTRHRTTGADSRSWTRPSEFPRHPSATDVVGCTVGRGPPTTTAATLAVRGPACAAQALQPSTAPICGAKTDVAGGKQAAVCAHWQLRRHHHRHVAQLGQGSVCWYHRVGVPRAPHESHLSVINAPVPADANPGWTCSLGPDCPAPKKVATKAQTGHSYPVSFEEQLLHFDSANHLAESIYATGNDSEVARALMANPLEHIAKGIGWYLFDGAFVRAHHKRIFVGSIEHMDEDKARLSELLGLEEEADPDGPLRTTAHDTRISKRGRHNLAAVVQPHGLRCAARARQIRPARSSIVRPRCMSGWGGVCPFPGFLVHHHCPRRSYVHPRCTRLDQCPKIVVQVLLVSLLRHCSALEQCFPGTLASCSGGRALSTPAP